MTTLCDHSLTLSIHIIFQEPKIWTAPIICVDDLGLENSSQQRKIWDTLVKQAGLEHRGIHSLRHTHASNLIDKETYPLAISRRLGHSSIKITMDIYTHFFERRKKKNAIRLQELKKYMKSG